MSAFAGLIESLGPLPKHPKVVVGVSGGADSMALAALTKDWIASVEGEIYAVLVDHGLRPAGHLEALVTRARLAAMGIPVFILRLRGILGDRAVERRARDARFRLLRAACGDLGAALLVLGHHASDQAETVLLRAEAGSAAVGLAAMAPRREMRTAAILRPLLAVPPLRLRGTLARQRLGWVEDLSNRAPAFHRSRLRSAAADGAGVGCGMHALTAASRSFARARARRDTQRNRVLAASVTFYPEGFAMLSPGPLPTAALARLLRALSGATFTPSEARLRKFAAAPHPATLAGVRFLSAGRMGEGLLAVREAAAMAAPATALPGAHWDGRFRLRAFDLEADGATLGPLGPDARRLRSRSSLPAVALATLPALRVGETLVAVPHLRYPDDVVCQRISVVFEPPEPAGGASFLAGVPLGL